MMVTRHASLNIRTGLLLLAVFAAMFVGSIIYIILYH